MEKAFAATCGAVCSVKEVEGIHLEIASLMSHQSRSAFSLKANGTTHSLVKLAQILTWIAETFRRPQYSTLSYSTSTFQKTGDACYSIAISDLEPIKDGLCWCPMFANGVIAKYFPTPKRHNEVGLEMSFDLMVMLGRIWYPMGYLNGFVLNGSSTILVPTLKTQHSVQWHFISNEDQNKKIDMSAIDTCCGKFVEDVGLRALRSARKFIGWTWDAHVHVGVSISGYDSIRDSKVPYSPRRPRLAREMASGIGPSGLGFFGMQLGTKAARQTDSETLLKILPFAERSSDDAQGSYEAIRNNRDLQLQSQANGDGEDLKFMTQVENVFAAIESRKEEIITRNNVSARFSYAKYLKG
ncbi:hypothetical protein P154DRAFT_529058 [Amniculicola lignicola CBS 123094]|uniref:Uncharacterized protein n=1 Tax=Amniculicola lignicola CBS 123094 TaxID=1392246 RepID=A0A6A5X3F6_9PLEO|nr:hypothetical protein P154DRAFT_529058 [Amniculicola lignicola CBS 123094]